jgi:hypothetical protein
MNRARPALPPHQHFTDHDGNTHGSDTDQVNKYECPTTVFAGYIGELPDVAETNGRARGS